MNHLSALRHRLLARIRRRYAVATEPVQAGGVRFDFTRVADPDRVLDEVAAEADLRDRLQGRRIEGDQLHLPYWAELWDSARGIAQFLADDAGICTAAPAQAGKGVPVSVLDLGCGMGLAGTMAAALGACVLFADLEPPALLFAQLNSLPWRRRVRTRKLDWQRDALCRRFDLILGADILYEKAQWPWLEKFWRRHLRPGGRILLGEPGRQTGEMFVEWIGGRGWILSPAAVLLPTRPTPIRIFTVTDQTNLSVET